MKHVAFLLFAILHVVGLAAQTSTRSFEIDGRTRTYIEYAPASISPTDSVPLLISLHGLGDNMTNFSNVGFHAIADTADFIVVTPQAIVDPLLSAAAWNSGAGALGIFPNSDVDDVGFISALIDTTAARFAIDTNRVYVTGFSMGGFMSNRLACELGDRIAAIASVAGTLGSGVSCPAPPPIPVFHLHGTDDATVGFSSNGFGMNAEEVVAHWVEKNDCDTAALIDTMPGAGGTYTTVRYQYENGVAGSEVQFFEVLGAGHAAMYDLEDYSTTAEIWRFFRPKTNEQAESPVDTTSLVRSVHEIDLVAAPNPAKDHIIISSTEPLDGQAVMYDALGRRLLHREVHGSMVRIDLPSSAVGTVQTLVVTTADGTTTRRIVRR